MLLTAIVYLAAEEDKLRSSSTRRLRLITKFPELFLRLAALIPDNLGRCFSFLPAYENSARRILIRTV